MATYLDIDQQDISKVLREAGSGRSHVDNNDIPMVLREMETALGIDPVHLNVDLNDVSGLIEAAQAVAEEDVTPPAVSAFSPLDNATGVLLAVRPSVTFNEEVVLGDGAQSFSLYKTTGDVLVQLWRVDLHAGSGLGQVELNTPVKVILHPTAPLTAATQYYITWTAGAVRDLAGNDVAAQASTTAWSFTTA